MDTPPSLPNAAQPTRLSIEAARHLLELALEADKPVEDTGAEAFPQALPAASSKPPLTRAA